MCGVIPDEGEVELRVYGRGQDRSLDFFLSSFTAI